MTSKGSVNARAQAGHYAFLTGVLIAIVLGFQPEITKAPMLAVLVILGLLVGLLNITQKETTEFLIASLVLIASISIADILPPYAITKFISDVLVNIVVFVAPAALIVALKAIYDLAESR